MDLINREQLIEECAWTLFDCSEVVDVDDIMRFPTVDAEPVKHGRWIEEGFVDGNQNRYCRCSECGKGDTQAISQRVPYCWWCGAKMDLDEVKNG